VAKIVFEFIKDNIYIILGGLCVVAIGVIYLASRGQTAGIVREEEAIAGMVYYAPTIVVEAPVEYTPTLELPTLVEQSTIFVHVVGEVYDPRVFELPYGSRVFEVLEMAGGLTEYADATAIIKSAILQDEMQIRVPAIGEDAGDVFIFAETPAGVTSATSPVVQTDGRVNINTATEAELQTITGIGPARAQAIVRFRDTHGNFSSVEELTRVPGIADGILNTIRDAVTVN